MAEVSAHFAADTRALLKSIEASDRASLTAIISQVLVAHANEQGIDLFA